MYLQVFLVIFVVLRNIKVCSHIVIFQTTSNIGKSVHEHKKM